MSADQHTTEQLSSHRDDDDERAFSLLVVAGNVTSSYPLEPTERLLVGRARHAHIRIDHGSVSREHAALAVGRSVSIVDLGSANGTRVRGIKLTPGVELEVPPDDVIDLGEVLLVVQYRRLEQRLQRICPWPFFELRLEEELERSRSTQSQLAVARFEVRGPLGARAVQLLLASELTQRELVSTSAPDVFEVLLLGVEQSEAERRAARARDLLTSRGSLVTVTVTRPSTLARDAEPFGRAPSPEASRRAALELGSFVVEDRAMRRVCQLLQRVAPSDLSVMLLGETGVGKEVCAELVHRASPRAGRKLLRLNCAALSESLLESELFGHERGAFTGAVGDKIGLLESASGGSVFLDELGDMPLATQVKLLRVLEAREVLRLGSRSPRPIDIRIISATNRDLQELITRGAFREDLYYRLNGISVLVPPLRERVDDIEPLARWFLRRAAERAGKALDFSGAALAWLRAQSWPGNVRHLKNVVERASVLSDGPRVEVEHLAAEAERARAAVLATTPPVDGLRAEVKALERERIEQALRDANGNQSRAAELLGISRGALLRRLEQLQVARPRRGTS